MNIVFLLRYWPIYGGGEMVTRLLANKFAELGYGVSIVYLWERTTENMPFINSNIKEVRIPAISKPYGEDGIIKSNYKQITNFLHSYFADTHIDIIINQWIPARIVYKAKNGIKVKLICCHHTNIYIKPHSTRLSHKIFFVLLQNRGITLYALKNLYPKYKYSDTLLMLSNALIKESKDLLKIKNNDHKIISIPNPLTYEQCISLDAINKKEKELLFVGRILDSVKRISYIITIWKALQDTGKYKDWKLTIVGDGPDLDTIKEYAAGLGYTHIYFEGYQNPFSYYQRGSIFLMTSSFEGWPMTLLEAQQNGCVPVVMDTFASLHEIVQHDDNGIIVKNDDMPGYISALQKLMSDEEYRRRLALRGLETCKRFSIEKVIQQWEALFKELKKQ